MPTLRDVSVPCPLPWTVLTPRGDSGPLSTSLNFAYTEREKLFPCPLHWTEPSLRDDTLSLPKTMPALRLISNSLPHSQTTLPSWSVILSTSRLGGNVALRRQCVSVVRVGDLHVEDPGSNSWHGLLNEFALGDPRDKSLRFVNSQLVCLLPVGVLNRERGEFLTWHWKAPLGELSLCNYLILSI